MNQSQRVPVGLIGVLSSFGLVPHLFFLLILSWKGLQVSIAVLVLSHFASILGGEWLVFESVAEDVPFSCWLRKAFHLRGYYLWAYIAEFLFDGLFLVFSIKHGWNPVNFFLLLASCRFFAAPIQVVFSHYFLSKNVSFFLTLPAQIPLLHIGENPKFFLYATILKGIFCNGIAIARSQYVSEINTKKTCI